MEGRIGKMTVEVWLHLPTGDEIREQCSDEQAGKIVLAEIAEATALAGMLMGETPVIGMEVVGDAVEVSGEVLDAFVTRAHAAVAEEQQEVTV